MEISKNATQGQDVVKYGVCCMCFLRCTTRIRVHQGKAVKIGVLNPKVAALCPRWKAQLDSVYHPDRLKYPLKRLGQRGEGAFERISWDEALDTVASKFQKIKDEYGAESVVFFSSHSAGKEAGPHFQRLAHAFGSPNCCSSSISGCFSSDAVATIVTYGRDYGGLSVQSCPVDFTSKCKLLWSSTVKYSAPPEWRDHLEARKKGLKLIVVDPRRTTIASMADIHLQLRPGTDGALALGMMNVIINEELYDKEFVNKWTVGFDDLNKLVQEYPLEKVAEITWVPASKIREAAIMYATLKPAQIGIHNTAATHSSNGFENRRAIIFLPALTGNFEMPGGNRLPTPPLPLRNMTLHERAANFPPGLGVDRFPLFVKLWPAVQANVIADQIESGKPYPLKAIFGLGMNIMYFPNTNRFVENLKKLDLIVVSDCFHTPATRLADIVLPAASRLEFPILLAMPGGYTKMVDPAIEPIGESRPDWDMFAELSQRWGIGDEFCDGDFEKYLNYMLEPSGMTLEELRKHPEGIMYPIPPRPAKYYEQVGFQTPSGKVEFASSIMAEYGYNPLPVYQEPKESPMSRPDLAKSFPLVLTAGARHFAYTDSRHRNIPQLRRLVPDPLVAINPSDAKPRGIQSGDRVTVSSPRGSIKVKALVTDEIMPSVVQVMHHWPDEANVNILVDDRELDPISGFPPYKAQLCQVTKGRI